MGSYFLKKINQGSTRVSTAHEAAAESDEEVSRSIVVILHFFCDSTNFLPEI